MKLMIDFRNLTRYSAGYGWMALLAVVLAGCRTTQPAPLPSLAISTPVILASATPTLEPTPPPTRLLSVCLGQEPESLFLYADGSPSARAVRAALYDGPYDVLTYQVQPVILQEAPSLANGGAAIESVTVKSGDVVAAPSGGLAALASGSFFLPAGCRAESCAAAYESGEVSMDQLVVRFRLKPGLVWSDGEALQADDSVYSFEVAQALFPRYRPELLNYTASYRALDETTVEWRGVPGYQDAAYRTFFFTPLPRHAWAIYPPADLLTQEAPNRAPLGWGPYRLQEWTPGDHITLQRSPTYSRSSEGLPHFDVLVFRFVENSAEAFTALQVGECDLIDETALFDADIGEWQALEATGSLRLVSGPGPVWEHLDFGQFPSDPARLSVFSNKEVRQAAAMCLDRQVLLESLYGGQGRLVDGYVPGDHPLAAADVRRYSYDPQAAASLLDAAGWRDSDGNAQTPRQAQGVSGFPDGSPLQVTYLTISGTLRTQSASYIQSALGSCGFGVEVSLLSRDEFFAPGPEGKLFGRNFDLAQFGWTLPVEPPCYLFTSAEIPGPPPEFPKGWGGGNPAGYRSAEFDAACRAARRTLPDLPEYTEAHHLAQQIFAEDLPVLPLYQPVRWMAARADLCGVALDVSVESPLWNIELLNYGDACGDRTVPGS